MKKITEHQDCFIYHTTFDKVVKLRGMQMAICNNIPDVDEKVWENFTGNYYDNSDEGQYIEIYQWYITGLDKWDVDWFVKHFNLIFTYSEMLDVWVLCVNHYGTSWESVDWYTDLPEFGDKDGMI